MIFFLNNYHEIFFFILQDICGIQKIGEIFNTKLFGLTL